MVGEFPFLFQVQCDYMDRKVISAFHDFIAQSFSTLKTKGTNYKINSSS